MTTHSFIFLLKKTAKIRGAQRRAKTATEKDHRIIVCSWCLMDLFVFMEKTLVLTRNQIIDKNSRGQLKNTKKNVSRHVQWKTLLKLVKKFKSERIHEKSQWKVTKKSYTFCLKIIKNVAFLVLNFGVFHHFLFD